MDIRYKIVHTLIFENFSQSCLQSVAIKVLSYDITTLVDFDSKWADMVAEGIEVPTAVTAERSENYVVGVYEGGGYRSKGIYRPVDVCRMRNNTAERFCPVCERALERVILHQTVKQ